MRTPGFVVTSIFKNPYIAVSVRARLRRRSTLLVGVAWAAVIILCIEMNYVLYSSPNYRVYPSLEHCFFSVFFQLIGVQFFLAFFLAAYYCSNSVSLERSTRTLPLLRATPLSGHAIAFGKLASDPAQVWLLLALAFPFTAVCAAVGKIDVGTFVQSYALMFAAAFFACNLGLLSSALGKRLTKPGQAGAASIGLILMMLFASQGMYRSGPFNSLAGLSPIPFFVSSIARRYPLPLPVDVNLNLNFLGTEVHPFVISFPVYILLGLVCFLGASRRIADDNVPVLSRAQTICAYILYQLVVCGVVVNLLHEVRNFTGRWFAVSVTGTEPMAAYSLFAFFGIVFAGMVSSPRRANVESSLRRPGTKGSLAWRWLGDDAASPLPLLGLLFAIAMCGYVFFSRRVVASVYSPLDIETLLLGAAMLVFCVTIYCLLVQSCYMTPIRQPVALAAAALVVYFVLPAIISGILQLLVRPILWAEYIYALNPMYALTRCFSDGPLTDTAFFVLGTVVYVAVIGALTFAVVSQLRGLRRHIDKMRASP